MHHLLVENMSCGHCVAAVTKAVQGVDGAAKVHVDLAGKAVNVESGAELHAISAAISAAGFPVVSTPST